MSDDSKKESSRSTRRAAGHVPAITAVIVLMLIAAWVRVKDPRPVAGRIGSSSSMPGISDEAVALAAREATMPRVVLAAAGDVMFDRGVRATTSQCGLDYPLGAVRSIFHVADIAFVNLETSIAPSSTGSRIPGKGIWFRSDPALASVLAENGIDVVSIANNHILDYDDPAFYCTIDALDRSGLAHAGGGINIWSARRPAVIRAGGMVFAFLAYTEMADIYWSRSNPKTFGAGPAKPGVAPACADIVREDVAAAAKWANHVIVSFHWGDEYVHTPAQRQVDLARLAIDSGASLVLGHHPHVLQPVEVYTGGGAGRTGVIFYSLGNFVFDQRKSDTSESMVAIVTFGPDRIERAEFVPARIDNCRPAPLSSWAAKAAVNKIAMWSRRNGTVVLSLNGRGRLILPPIYQLDSNGDPKCRCQFLP